MDVWILDPYRRPSMTSLIGCHRVPQRIRPHPSPAEAVRDGAAAVDGTTVHLIAVDEVDAHWDVLDDADAIIFGSPTYMAGASAPFKAFLDATSPRWAEQRWQRQAGRRVHQLGRDERRQARHPAAVRPVRHAARHGLGRPRPAPRQPHQLTGRPTTSTGWPGSSARWRSRTPTKAPSWRRRWPIVEPPSTSAAASPTWPAGCASPPGARRGRR